MRIAAILPHLLIFGGVRRYLELGNGFVERGHDFTLYTPEGTPPDWTTFEGKILPLDLIGREPHDIVMCGTPEQLEHLDRSPSRLRIFYLQGEDVRGERAIVRSGKYEIMTNSSGLARRAARRYGIETLDGAGGVNERTFHPVFEPRRSAKLRILCYGRLSRPRKGTRYVVGAVASMRRAGYDVELHLFDSQIRSGEDPRIMFEAGVPFRYYLNLPQERMARMYGAADVFVAVERRAGWCNTAAEAAACGLPLICSKSGTMDFAFHERTALVLPLRGTWFVRRALTRIYRDREFAAKLCRAARERILDFTWDKVCARMERLFEQRLDANKGGTV